MGSTGRVAFVTGASRGIGEAIARALAEDGAAVALAARSRDRLEALAAALAAAGARASVHRLDVTDRDSVAAAVAAATAALGPIDILVNNAGIAESAPFLEMDDALWDEHLRVNLTGAYWVTKAVLGGMIERRWGRIVNVASTAAKVGYLYTTAYCASKHGLMGLTRALALEVARHGVTVNAVCPGFVATEMTERSVERIARKTGLDREAARARLASFSPQNRIIEPEEVARVVVTLCGEEARGINGQGINIDGGAVAY